MFKFERRTTEIFATTLTGHGNPATAIAARRLNTEPITRDRDNPLFFIKRVAQLTQLAHKIMTALPALASRYSKHEDVRTGLAAHIFSFLAKHELFNQINKWEQSDPYTLIDDHKILHLVQAHPLLTTTDRELTNRGIHQVALYNPDSFPKPEVIDILIKLKKVTLYIWNPAAKNYISDQLKYSGIPLSQVHDIINYQVQIIPPFLFEQLFPAEQTRAEQQRTVVVKTSGSGIPTIWMDEIIDKLELLTVHNLTWSFHTPNGKYEAGVTGKHCQFDRYKDGSVIEAYQSFLADIGPKTQCIISYPSEVVQIIHELKQSNQDILFACLPPRGSHEVHNLLTAISSGVNICLLESDHIKQPEKMFPLRLFRELHLPVPSNDSIQTDSAYLYPTVVSLKNLSMLVYRRAKREQDSSLNSGQSAFSQALNEAAGELPDNPSTDFWTQLFNKHLPIPRATENLEDAADPTDTSPRDSASNSLTPPRNTHLDQTDSTENDEVIDKDFGRTRYTPDDLYDLDPTGAPNSIWE